MIVPPPTGASTLKAAADALRVACLATVGTPAASALHETYDHVLAEPVPADMQAAAAQIGRGKR